MVIPMALRDRPVTPADSTRAMCSSFSISPSSTSGPPMGFRIAYFTGSFPAHTHTFFWREIQALRELGVTVDLVSTRLPRDLCEDAWGKLATSQTSYLVPITPREVIAMVGTVLRTGPSAWCRTIASWVRADGSLRERLELLGYMVVGAKLACLAQRRGWQHVHVGFTENAANIALYANRLSGVSYSVSQGHSLRNAGGNQREKWRHAAFGVPNTEFVKREIEQVLAGSLPPMLRVAPRGIDCRYFQRSTPYRSWDGHGAARLFSCGRLTRAKGHAESIQAVAALRNSGIDVELRIAGDESSGGSGHRQNLIALAEKLNVGHVVHFLGTLSQNEVRTCLEQAHIFVLGTHDECFGNAVAEAMAMEVPVVTTAVGGLPELIDDGVHGFLVPPRNSEAMSRAIKLCLRSSVMATEMGRRAREKIAQQFYPRRGVEVIVECIQQTIARSAVPMEYQERFDAVF